MNYVRKMYLLLTRMIVIFIFPGMAQRSAPVLNETVERNLLGNADMLVVAFKISFVRRYESG